MGHLMTRSNKPENKKSSETQTVDSKGVEFTILDAIQPAAADYGLMLLAAEKNKVNGTLRFSVKLERGRALTYQIGTDDMQSVDYPVDEIN